MILVFSCKMFSELSKHKCSRNRTSKQYPALSSFSAKPPFTFQGISSGNEIINKLLDFSFSQQMENDITDDPGFIAIVVQRCLAAVGVSTKIIFGERKYDKNDNFKPHVWLLIEGCVVDNCYIQELTDKMVKFIEDNVCQCYKECDLDSSILTDSNKLDNNSSLKKCLLFYVTKPDKALALSLNREQHYNYYFEMIRYMHDKYKTSIIGIDPSVHYICWYCDCFPKEGKSFISDIFLQEISEDRWVEAKCSSSWRFFHCKQCMVASYCDKACQKSDWNEIHNITCLSRSSVCQSPLKQDEEN